MSTNLIVSVSLNLEADGTFGDLECIVCVLGMLAILSQYH